MSRAGHAPKGVQGSEQQGSAPRRTLRDVLILLVGGQILAGVLVGLVWRAWSPHTLGYVVAAGAGRGSVIPDESESQIAGDGRFVLLCMLVGLAAALGAWQLRRARGAVTLLCLVAGALLGSLVARQVGTALATGHSSGAVNTTIRLPLRLHADALLTAQAMVAAAVYVLLSGLSSREELGADVAGGRGSGGWGSGGYASGPHSGPPDDGAVRA